MNNATGRCVPLAGYYNVGTVTEAAPCSANCITCTSSSSCTVCEAYYNISGGACWPFVVVMCQIAQFVKVTLLILL